MRSRSLTAALVIAALSDPSLRVTAPVHGERPAYEGKPHGGKVQRANGFDKARKRAKRKAHKQARRKLR